MKSHVSNTSKSVALAAGLLLGVMSMTCIAGTVIIEMDLPELGSVEAASRYIVQSSSVETAARAVEAVGGEVTVEFYAIEAVGATLLPAQVELLKRRADVKHVTRETTEERLSARGK